MSTFSLLEKELETYLPKEQIHSIREAYLLADIAHKGQLRSSGDPFITHPLSVARILAGMRMDSQSIMAALLHDVIEDTQFTKSVIEEKFGQEVANLVDGVTKLTQIKFESRAEAQAENFRKMFIAMVHDIRVILVKLADRLHNMRTLEYFDAPKRKRIAKETLEIYSPISNRLGMNNFRIEFEELGFEMLYPMRYHILKDAVKKARGNRKEIVGKIESTLKDLLLKMNLSYLNCWGREKHLYSIYKKMRNKHLSFFEIMDVYAFRVIVKTVDECYRVLGAAHNLYKPFPARFKDYIAIPKANGYQSLHTVLFGPYGVPVEIQIRTEEMDRMAENGIAAHWLYKSGDKTVYEAQARTRDWIKGLLEIQQSTGNSLEFIENVKIDLFPDDVYVFTPQGEIMELPRGATAVDFAYAVHSDIGNFCVGVKIDRRLAPLSTRLSNGQTVEVLASPSACPDPAWLNFVITGKARSKIKHFLKQQKRTDSISLGKRLIEQALNSLGETIQGIDPDHIKTVLESSGTDSLDMLYKEVGLGNQLAQMVAQRLLNSKVFERSDQHLRDLKPLRIKGSEGLAVTFAKCCHPIPGDPIEGVLTAGQGIIIHHNECRNLNEIRRQANQTISLCWEESVEGNFEVELHLEILNQQGALGGLAIIIADVEANIESVNSQEKDGRCNLVILILSVRNRGHLARVLRRIRESKSVLKVIRYRNS